MSSSNQNGRERESLRDELNARGGRTLNATSAAGVRKEMARIRSLLQEDGHIYGARLPPLLLQHQLYANVTDRTLVDRTVVRRRLV